MTRTARNRLTDVEIRKAARPLGKPLADGGNLFLGETDTGSLRWRVRYYFRGKRQQIWLAPEYPKLSLKDARKRRDDIEAQIEEGVDPKVARKAGGAVSGMTFRAFVEAHGEDLAPLAPKGRREWLHAMKTKVGLLADMEPGQITGDHIAMVMQPIWTAQPATAKKRLSAIASVLRAARGRGVISAPHWSNPADYRASFSGVMRKPVVVETPREAMPYGDVPAFIRDLRACDGAVALGLQFIVLTGVRASEGLAASWGEIDRDAKVWRIPPARMKGPTGQKREHVVPLSAAALDLLDRAAPRHGPKPAGGDYIFASRTHAAGHYDPGAALDLLRTLRPGTLTTHGFRSSFFDWATEATDYSDRLANAALAHVVKDRVQRAYDRSAQVEKRRPLMADWGTFCVAACVPAANSDAAPEREPAEAPAEAA